MFAYGLILLAIASRLIPHPALLNFTAVGGSLLYFGARRPLAELVLPVGLLAAADYYLTTVFYNYPFHAQSYVVTWVWYAAAIIFGARILKSRASGGRIVGASVLSATSFFVLSNFAVWVGAGLYPYTPGGLAACYAAALPFYRNDLVSTILVAGVAFATPQLADHLVHWYQATTAKTA